MILRVWRIVPARSCSNEFFSHFLEAQTASAATTIHSFRLALRGISSTVDRRTSDGTGHGTGNGGPSEPVKDALLRDIDEDQGAEDKRMWRKWIEERLGGQTGSAVKETNSSLSRNSHMKGPVRRSSAADRQRTQERSPRFRKSFFVEDMGKGSSQGEESGGGKRSPSLDSFFKTALTSSSNAGNAGDSRTFNLRNPFRPENVKSNFFPNRESSKNTSASSRRGSFFQGAGAKPSIFPGRRMPSKTSQTLVDDLRDEDLDEFEKRVLGSANDAHEGLEALDDDFLGVLDDIERSARGIKDEGNYNLEPDEDEDWGDEKAQGLTDLALSNSEEFDLEDEDNPYRMRPDRLFFPGQTYDPEDLNLSKEPDLEKPTSRTRKKYPSKEVFQIADFRNPRYLSSFLRESSRILPRRHFQITAKAQRKVAREIKTARILGLMPFTSMGDPPFRFLRSWSEEDSSYRVDEF